MNFVLLALALYAFIAGSSLYNSLLAGDVLHTGLVLVPLLLLGLSHIKKLRIGATLCFCLSLIYPLYLQEASLSVAMTTVYALAYLGVFFALLYLALRSLETRVSNQNNAETRAAEVGLETDLLGIGKRAHQIQRQVLARPRPSLSEWLNRLAPLLFNAFWLGGLAIIWASSHAQMASNMAITWTLLMTIAGQQYFWPLLISNDWLAYKTRRSAEADLKQQKSISLRYAFLLVFGLSLLSYTVFYP